MSEIKDGGPAFPRDHRHNGHNGMTLRDYFAAKALVGLFAIEANPRVGVEVEPYSDKCNDAMALQAYRIADAMLRAREAS